MRLDSLGTRFVDPEVERRFRVDSIPDETRVAVAVQGTWVLVLVAFAGNDFILFRGAMLGLLLAVRVVVVGSGLAVIWYLRRSRAPDRRDAALVAVLVVQVLGGLVINYVRPPQVTALFATNLLGILIAWALLPLPVRLQALSAGMISAGAIAMILFKPGTLHRVEVVRLTLELALANGVGIWVSLISQRERRARWAAVLASEQAGRELLATQRELAEARMTELRSRLVQVQRAGGMGSLAVSIAHEIGQPLTAVRNNAFAARAYLERRPADVDRAVSALDDVTSGADRVAAIIQRTRDYLRRGESTHEWVEPAQVAGDAVALVRPDAERREVELSVDVGPGSPVVRGDRVQLVQVAVIALVNALDAVADGAPPRQVRLWARSGADGFVMGVDDGGPGFPPGQHDRIFDPFFTTKPAGMGMGLPIAREIVEAHGGAIEAGPAPGGGARVSWRIPAPAGGDAAPLSPPIR